MQRIDFLRFEGMDFDVINRLNFVLVMATNLFIGLVSYKSFPLYRDLLEAH